MIRAVGARAVALLAAFLFSATVARFLGLELAGAFFVTYTVIALLATVGRFGTDNLALRLLGGDSATPRADTIRLILIAAMAGTAASLVGLLIVPFLIGEKVAPLSVVLVASCVVAQALAVLSGTLLRGMGLLAAGVFAELGSLPLVATAAILVGHLILPGGMTLDVSLAAMALGAWTTVAWSLPVAIISARRRLTDAESSNLAHRGFLAAHLKRLASMMGTSTLAYGLAWAPIFALTSTGDLSEVSIYSVALRVANIVAILPTIQISYLAPEFARKFYSGDIESLNLLAGRSALQVSVATAIPLLALVALSEPIVTTIFGEDFAPAAPVVVILSIAVFLVMIVGQVNQLMLLCGLEGVALSLALAGIIVWATFGLWLASVGGATATAWLGAAWSVLYALAASGLLKRRTGIKSYARI